MPVTATRDELAAGRMWDRIGDEAWRLASALAVDGSAERVILEACTQHACDGFPWDDDVVLLRSIVERAVGGPMGEREACRIAFVARLGIDRIAEIAGCTRREASELVLAGARAAAAVQLAP